MRDLLTPQTSRSADSTGPGSSGLPQPCAFFDGCRCRIYDERPQYCRNFDCALLKRVRAGQVTPAAALKTVGTARTLAEKVRKWLGNLGDTDEHLPLSVRVRRTSGRLQDIGMDKATAEVYGRLTLAFHDLNFLLSDAFYPGR